MALTKAGALSIVLLAVSAAAAFAQDCPLTRQTHKASLANVSPKGCLKEIINATAVEGLVTAECFNKLNLNLTNHTGAEGCPTRTFTVGFEDTKKCAEGIESIAQGTLNATKQAGVFEAGGTFTTGTPFKGTLNAKNQLTVTAEGSTCELTYALKAVGKPEPVEANTTATADDAKATANGTDSPAKSTDTAPGASPAPAGAAAPKKSSGAAAGASVLFAVLSSAWALLV